MALLLDYDTRDWDVAREVIDLGMLDGLIERRGDYFHIAGPDGEIKRHGIPGTVKLLRQEDELREFLVTCIEEQTALLASGEDDG